MGSLPDDTSDTKLDDDLRAQLRDDKDLRAFLKQFLTKRSLEKQAESIQKVVATGLPVVGDSLTILREEKGSPLIVDRQVLVPLGESLIDDIVRKRASQIVETIEQKGERTQQEPLGPPFEEATLAMPEHFVDRQRDLAWLVERLEAGRTTGITALRGMGGIGKTTLAAAAIRQLRGRGDFPDGIAVVLCQDVTNASEVLREVLTHFDPHRVPPRTNEIAELADIARRTFQDKRALVVLDNVEPELAIDSVARPLREAGATLLITARQVISSTVVPVEGSFILELLPPEEALRLLLDSCGRRDIEQLDQPQQIAAKQIVDLLGRHTLAIKLAGAYAANANRDLTALASNLAGLPGALALPDGDVPGIMVSVFKQSTDALPEEARRLFFVLPAFGNSGFGRKAAISLAHDIGVNRPEAAVDLLVMRSLLEAVTDIDMPEAANRERLRLHPLLRAFALIEFERKSEDERATYYRHIAKFYESYLEQVAADDGIEVDRANINRVLDWAIEHGESRLLVNLCLGMRCMWLKRWHTVDSAHYLSYATEAADMLTSASGAQQDRLNAANLWLSLAQTLRRIGKPDQAEKVFESNLQLRREIGDKPGEGVILYQLGQLFRSRAQLAAAEQYFSQSKDIRRELGDRPGEAECLGYLGRVAQARGRLRDAEEYFTQSLKIAQQLQDGWGEGRVLNSLGQVALTRGRLNEAEKYFSEALTLLREQGDQHGEEDVLTGLARLAIDRGHWDEAERYLQAALEIDRKIQDTQGVGADLSQLAIVALRQGRLDEAEALVQESMPIRQHVQDRRGEGVDVSIQGEIALARGLTHEARKYYDQALAIASEVENQRGVGDNLHQLGVIAQELGMKYEAVDYFQQSLSIAREIESEPDVARALLSLGSIFVTLQSQKDEGCRMITDAVQLYRQMGRRETRRSEDIAVDLGCA